MKYIFLVIILIFTFPVLAWAKLKPTAEIGFLTFPNDPEHSELVRLGFKALKKPVKSGANFKHWEVIHPRIIGGKNASKSLFGLTPPTKERKEWFVFNKLKNLGKLSSWSTLSIKKSRSIFYYLASHDVVGIVNSSYKLKNPEAKYATSLGADKHKPLLLFNRTEYKDPENWKLSSKSDCATEAIDLFYRSLSNYTFIHNKTRMGSRQAPFTKKDVNIIACYINNKNKKLVGLNIPDYTLINAGNNHSYNFWYSNFQDSLRSYSFNAMPVAYGDFNNNGYTEWLFQTISSHNINNEGYMLRDNNTHMIYFVSWPDKSKTLK